MYLNPLPSIHDPVDLTSFLLFVCFSKSNQTSVAPRKQPEIPKPASSCPSILTAPLLYTTEYKNDPDSLDTSRPAQRLKHPWLKLYSPKHLCWHH